MFMLVPQLKCFTIQSLRATGKQNRGITYYTLENSGTGLFLCWLKISRHCAGHTEKNLQNHILLDTF